MADDLPTHVDEYLSELLVPSDAILDAAVQAGLDARMPQMQVCRRRASSSTSSQIQGAKRILEIGTLAGYSTIWLGRALPPDGRLISLELNPRHAEVARANLRRAGLDRRSARRLGRRFTGDTGRGARRAFRSRLRRRGQGAQRCGTRLATRRIRRRSEPGRPGPSTTGVSSCSWPARRPTDLRLSPGSRCLEAGPPTRTRGRSSRPPTRLRRT